MLDEAATRFGCRFDKGQKRIILIHREQRQSWLHKHKRSLPHRAEQYDFLILSQWSDATDSDRNVKWTRALFQAMQPHREESVYVNNLGDEGPVRVKAAYGENYRRLAALRGTYDQDNLFRANQNIEPSRK